MIRNILRRATKQVSKLSLTTNPARRNFSFAIPSVQAIVEGTIEVILSSNPQSTTERVDIVKGFNNLMATPEGANLVNQHLQTNPALSGKIQDLVEAISNDLTIDHEDLQLLMNSSLMFHGANSKTTERITKFMEGMIEDGKIRCFNIPSYVKAAILAEIYMPGQNAYLTGASLTNLRENLASFEYFDQMAISQMIGHVQGYEEEKLLIGQRFGESVKTLIKNATIDRLKTIYPSLILTRENDEIQDISNLVERKFLEHRYSLIDISQITEMASFFGHANHQSDELWPFFEDTFSNLVEVLNVDQCSDIIHGFAYAERGDQVFWDKIVGRLNEQRGEMTFNQKVYALRGLIRKGIQDEYWVRDVVLNDIFTSQLQSQVELFEEDTVENLIFIALNSEFVSLDKREEVENLTAQLWESLNPTRQEAIWGLYQNAEQLQQTEFSKILAEEMTGIE